MRAIAIEGYGEPDVARLVELPEPVPGPTDVVVRTRAAALNHLDLWTSSGALGFDIAFPFVLGADGAGEIHTIGDAVSDLAPGTAVLIDPALSCGECEYCAAGEQSLCVSFRMLGEHVDGTFAELVRVPARNVYRFPSHLSFVEAAALGVTFTTAYRMLFTQGGLKPGKSVLITGIGGGLALSLLQLARPVADKVFVTSSSDDKLERALALGADKAINYRTQDVGVEVRRLTAKRGVDLVADSAGGASVNASLRSLAKGGRLVISGATAGREATVDLRRLFWNQLSIIGSTMGSHADIKAMLDLVGRNGVRPIVDRVLPLEQAADALRYLAAQEQFGKVVLEVS